MLMTAYIRANNTAHKVKKMYVGDSTGKARCMYNPKKCGGINPTNSTINANGNRSGAYGINIANLYALLCGGSTTSYNSDAQYSSVVQCFNNSTKTVMTKSLRHGSDTMRTSSVGNYALIGGAHYYSFTAPKGHYYPTTIDVFNSSLTRSAIDDVPVNGRGNKGIISNYALFTSGSTLTSFNSSLTSSTATITGLSTHRIYTFGTGGLFLTSTTSGVYISNNLVATNKTFSELNGTIVSIGNTLISYSGNALCGLSSNYVLSTNPNGSQNSVTGNYIVEQPVCSCAVILYASSSQNTIPYGDAINDSLIKSKLSSTYQYEQGITGTTYSQDTCYMISYGYGTYYWTGYETCAYY